MKKFLRFFGIGKKEISHSRPSVEKFHPTIWTANGDLMPFMRKVVFYSLLDKTEKKIVCCPPCEAWTVPLILSLEDFEMSHVEPADKTERFCEICQEIF